MGVVTVQCPICGEPYKFYSFSAADQSACPQCVAKAEAKEGKPRRTSPWRVCHHEPKR